MQVLTMNEVEQVSGGFFGCFSFYYKPVTTYSCKPRYSCEPKPSCHTQTPCDSTPPVTVPPVVPSY